LLTEPERLVVNTGPLIALGRVTSLEFVAPVQVADEIIRWAYRNRSGASD